MKLGPCLAFAVLASVLSSAPASALELQDAQQSHLAVTVPDGWNLSTDGAWSVADAPDHRARVRIAGHGRGVLGEAQAEAYLIDFIAQLWSTYTVDRHIRHVACGRFAGLEISGHGSGDSWDRASFQLFVLVDPSNVQKAAVVLLTGRSDAWETLHPGLERAVHALH